MKFYLFLLIGTFFTFWSCKKNKNNYDLSSEIPCLYETATANLDTNNNYITREYHYSVDGTSYSSYWYGYAISSEDTLGFPKYSDNFACANFTYPNPFTDSSYIKFTCRMIFRKGETSGNSENKIKCDTRDEILYLLVKKNIEPSGLKKCYYFTYRFNFDGNRIPYHDGYGELSFDGTYYIGYSNDWSDRPPRENNYEKIRFKIKAP